MERASIRLLRARPTLLTRCIGHHWHSGSKFEKRAPRTIWCPHDGSCRRGALVDGLDVSFHGTSRRRTVAPLRGVSRGRRDVLSAYAVSRHGIVEARRRSCLSNNEDLCPRATWIRDCMGTGRRKCDDDRGNSSSSTGRYGIGGGTRRSFR